MKYKEYDVVTYYGRKGTVINMNPATRKYLVEFCDDDNKTLEILSCYESELVKNNESDD